MFHKEGNNIILGTFSICIAIALVTNNFIDNAVGKTIILASLIIVLILILQFFRNPKRLFTLSDDQVMSPVDGKVVVIEEVLEKEYFNEKRLQISVFMSPLNVHITRFPVSGTVVLSKYHAGKFLVAWHPKSSEENERTTVVVKSKKFGDVLYRQIAGALAKRIVNYAVEGKEARQTDDSGFIKFGSRVDVFLPLDTKINVKLHQKVKGGITVLASK